MKTTELLGRTLIILLLFLWTIVIATIHYYLSKLGLRRPEWFQLEIDRWKM